jgi:hypothetical protein
METIMLDRNALLTALKTQIQALGLKVIEDKGDGFRAEQENILVKWLLGQRKVLYRMAVRLADADHSANFRDMVKENSWGLLPPTLTIETTSLHGTERSGTHEERSLAGGGKVDFGKVREALKKSIADAGWAFHYEAGRVP